ncbi:DUF3006 family protein [Heyndrickxia sp. NPDC080065]
MKEVKFPRKRKVGEVTVFKNGNYEIDNNQTEKLRKEIEDLMDEVWDD